MNPVKLIVALGVLLLPIPRHSLLAQKQPDCFKEHRARVYLVGCQLRGSGFLFRWAGFPADTELRKEIFLLTALHIVTGCVDKNGSGPLPRIPVWSHDRQRYDLEIAFADKARDIAFLRFDRMKTPEPIPYVPLSPTSDLRGYQTIGFLYPSVKSSPVWVDFSRRDRPTLDELFNTGATSPKEAAQRLEATDRDRLFARSSPQKDTAVYSFVGGIDAGFSGAPILETNTCGVVAMADGGRRLGAVPLGPHWGIPLDSLNRPTTPSESELRALAGFPAPYLYSTDFQIGGVKFVPFGDFSQHNSLLISSHETTVEQYQACIDRGICTSPPAGRFGREMRNLPVTGITGEQARQFCRNHLETLKNVPAGWETDLPTAEEWRTAEQVLSPGLGSREIACKANFLDSPHPAEARACASAFARSEAEGPTPPTMLPGECSPGRKNSFAPLPTGCYSALRDIHDFYGNVEEWITTANGAFLAAGGNFRMKVSSFRSQPRMVNKTDAPVGFRCVARLKADAAK